MENVEFLAFIFTPTRNETKTFWIFFAEQQTWLWLTSSPMMRALTWNTQVQVWFRAGTWTQVSLEWPSLWAIGYSGGSHSLSLSFSDQKFHLGPENLPVKSFIKSNTFPPKVLVPTNWHFSDKKTLMSKSSQPALLAFSGRWNGTQLFIFGSMYYWQHVEKIFQVQFSK